jgi:hypothetical protein
MGRLYRSYTRLASIVNSIECTVWSFNNTSHPIRSSKVAQHGTAMLYSLVGTSTRNLRAEATQPGITPLLAVRLQPAVGKRIIPDYDH